MDFFKKQTRQLDAINQVMSYPKLTEEDRFSIQKGFGNYNFRRNCGFGVVLGVAFFGLPFIKKKSTFFWKEITLVLACTATSFGLRTYNTVLLWNEVQSIVMKYLKMKEQELIDAKSTHFASQKTDMLFSDFMRWIITTRFLGRPVLG